VSRETISCCTAKVGFLRKKEKKPGRQGQWLARVVGENERKGVSQIGFFTNTPP